MEEKILKLKYEMAELLKWKEYFLAQQFSFPIGIETRKIINTDMLVLTKETAALPTYDLSLEVSIDGNIYWLSAKKN